MPPDAICTWCNRPPGDVSKLIAGPHVFICDACIASAEQRVRGEPAGGFAAGASRSIAARCAFCSKRAGGERTLVAAAAGNVCTDCLRVCREILDAG